MSIFADSNSVFQNRMLTYIDKKYQSKGLSVWLLHRRTLGTAFRCIDEFLAEEHENDQYMLFLYHLEQQAHPVYRPIISACTSQLELLLADKEKFVKGLHKFYTNMADQIKKENGYERYFMALSFVQEYNVRGVIIDGTNTDLKPISHAMIDLLYQLTEYLRPNRYDLNQMIVGITTSGELMTRNDPFPMSDYIFYRIEQRAKKEQPKTQLEFCGIIHDEFSKHGYPEVYTPEDVAIMATRNNFFTNILFSMIRFSSEYTSDMLPKIPLNSQPWFEVKDLMLQLGNKITCTQLMEELQNHRRRTLPGNGIKVTFEHPKFFFKSLFLKEIYKDDTIFLLYRFSADEDGDLCGYYDTRRKWFWSPLYDATIGDDDSGTEMRSLEYKIRDLVLWIYAAYACNIPGILSSESAFKSMFHTATGDSVAISFYTMGNIRRTSSGATETRPLNKADYTEGERSINGYVRKLPAGQRASEKAQQLAESLGFSLSEDETYVQPFIRRQWLKPSN